MSFFHSNNFQDRQAAAAQAKKAMAEKFLSRPKYNPNDPAVLEREAKRRAVLEARETREVERLRRKAEAEAAEVVRRAAEEALRQEALRQEELIRQAAEAAKRAEEERLDYERKLDRDARYAARKERKKKAKNPFERYG
jgi:uncharacterized protein DUF6481